MSQNHDHTQVLSRDKTDLKKPIRYWVILHNDHYTTMDFVVFILVSVFHKSQEEAEHLMIKIHQDGQAAIGLYTKEIALTKVRQVEDEASSENFPLKASISPEEE